MKLFTCCALSDLLYAGSRSPQPHITRIHIHVINIHWVICLHSQHTAARSSHSSQLLRHIVYWSITKSMVNMMNPKCTVHSLVYSAMFGGKFYWHSTARVEVHHTAAVLHTYSKIYNIHLMLQSCPESWSAYLRGCHMHVLRHQK